MALSMAASSTFNAGLAGLERPVNAKSQARGAMTVCAAAARKQNVRAATAAKSGNTMAYVKTLPGVSAPFGDVFDPMNLIERTSVAEMRRYREAEITHSRVAMLAALGFLVGEQLEDFPLFFNFDGNVTGPAITQFQQVGQGFWEPLVLVIGICEAYRVAVGWASPSTGINTLKEDYDMGDLGYDPLGIRPTDADELFALQTKELNNGRLAMVGIAGMIVQEFNGGQEIFQHWTSSRL